MYELIQVSGNDYYIQSPAKIGIVRTGEDPLSYLETLESVKKMRAARFVPSHAAVTQEIAPLAQVNIDKVNEIARVILGICREQAVGGGDRKKPADLEDAGLNGLEKSRSGSSDEVLNEKGTGKIPSCGTEHSEDIS